MMDANQALDAVRDARKTLAAMTYRQGNGPDWTITDYGFNSVKNNLNRALEALTSNPITSDSTEPERKP
jgi:hypothetical protein